MSDPVDPTLGDPIKAAAALEYMATCIADDPELAHMVTRWRATADRQRAHWSAAGFNDHQIGAVVAGAVALSMPHWPTIAVTSMAMEILR